MHPYTLLFLVALAATTAMRLWLQQRQLQALAAHRDRVPEPFSAVVTAAEHRRAADYNRDGIRLARLQLLYGTALLLAVTLGGGFAALDAAAGRLGWPAPWDGVATLTLLALVLGLANLPFSLYDTFVVEARHGFNRTTPALYAADLARSLALGLVLGVPLLALLLWLMTIAGPAWWLYAWAAWAAFLLALQFAWPRFIAPLYNRFRPLEAGPLRDRVDAIVRRCGFAADGVYVMDGSRRSSHGNAYFTGFGRHKRIVLYDTLVERLDADEVEAVLAHELGHFRLKHVRTMVLVGLAVAFAGFAVLGWLAAQPAFYAALGVPEPSPHAALALFVLASPAFTYFLDPLETLWSRHNEYAADRYAAEHADGQRLADALVKLHRDNASTLTPDPLYSAWYYSHPPALERIAALRASVPAAGSAAPVAAR
ncbi:MAG: M48 family metallopeptidase [Steroidobacteraceae bacterium]|nr:M48 family metallopeptidase [Steroidobacteraceae bacterium]